VLDEMPGREARQVAALLKFDENSAGGMMTPEFIFVGETSTRDEAIEWIRGRDVELEQLDTIFLINLDAKLSGAVAVARLLLAPAEQQLVELKSEPLVSIMPDADEKEVFELFDKYNLRSLGVVDAEGHQIGAITVDDVVTRTRAHV
jgi:magnesium transporter